MTRWSTRRDPSTKWPRASTSSLRPRSSACGTTRSRAIRRDLRLWVDQIAHAGQGWIPEQVRVGVRPQDGGPLGQGRDPDSRSEPVLLDGRFLLHGSIDLVEDARTPISASPITRPESTARKDHMIVGGGRSAAAGAVLAGARGRAPDGRSSRDGSITRRPPADSRRPDSARRRDAPSRRRGARDHRPRDRDRLPRAGAGREAPAPGATSGRCADRRPSGAPAGKSRDPLADLIALRRKP